MKMVGIDLSIFIFLKKHLFLRFNPTNVMPDICVHTFNNVYIVFVNISSHVHPYRALLRYVPLSPSYSSQILQFSVCHRFPFS